MKTDERAVIEEGLKIVERMGMQHPAGPRWVEKAQRALGIKLWDAKRKGVDAFQIEGPQWQDCANLFHVKQGAAEKWDLFNRRVEKIVELLNSPVWADEKSLKEAAREAAAEDLEDYEIAAQMLGEWGFNVTVDDHEIGVKTSGDTYYFLGGGREWMVKRVHPENGIEVGERQKLFANVEAESRCGSAAELAKAIVIFLTDL